LSVAVAPPPLETEPSLTPLPPPIEPEELLEVVDATLLVVVLKLPVLAFAPSLLVAVLEAGELEGCSAVSPQAATANGTSRRRNLTKVGRKSRFWGIFLTRCSSVAPGLKAQCHTFTQ